MAGRPWQVAALVYIAAFALDTGESCATIAVYDFAGAFNITGVNDYGPLVSFDPSADGVPYAPVLHYTDAISTIPSTSSAVTRRRQGVHTNVSVSGKLSIGDTARESRIRSPQHGQGTSRSVLIVSGIPNPVSHSLVPRLYG